ncbi:MAG: carbohydrate kinase family protein [Thermotogota bacterium]
MFDFISFGEILIDMISTDYVDGLKNSNIFEKHFGGSPANIAMNMSSQGFKSSVISKIGQDPFGEYILSRMKKSKVNTDFIKIDNNFHTDIVFVLKSQFSPEFYPYRSSSLNLDVNEDAIEAVKKSKIFHFSTWSFASDNNLEILLKLLKVAKENDTYVGFDPNYREILWHSSIDIKNAMKIILPYCDLVKPSDDDAIYIFGENSKEKFVDIFHELGAKKVILTLGKDGSLVSNGKDKISQPSYAKKVIDTTGAGDAFWSGTYIGFLEGFDIFDSAKLGNSFSAENLKKVGAVLRLKDYHDLIEKYIKRGD